MCINNITFWILFLIKFLCDTEWLCFTEIWMSFRCHAVVACHIIVAYFLKNPSLTSVWATWWTIPWYLCPSPGTGVAYSLSPRSTDGLFSAKPGTWVWVSTDYILAFIQLFTNRHHTFHRSPLSQVLSKDFGMNDIWAGKWYNYRYSKMYRKSPAGSHMAYHWRWLVKWVHKPRLMVKMFSSRQARVACE